MLPRIIYGCFFSLMVFGGAVVGADQVQIGQVKGTINFCSQGGLAGMQVYVPGRQLIVITGPDGQFLFEFMPVGDYQFNYAFQGKLLNSHAGVKVYAGRENNLGEIAFCDETLAAGVQLPSIVPLKPLEGAATESATTALPSHDCRVDPTSAACVDADNDGVVAGLDCDDNNALKRPGLIERCDGQDNNCNGIVDDTATITIHNGFGACVAGKVTVASCLTGFSDCDKASANGCEVDISNDNDNCGSCGNECSSMDLCRLGSC